MLSRAESNPGGVAPVDPATDQNRRTLLIVDDEEGPRQSLRILFKNDYEVLLAESGPQALELARERSVAAAILDIRMAGMSGIDVLNHLKAIDPAIEVVMLTAYATIDTARDALRLGACDYITKPFEISSMRAAVANAMERHLVFQEIHRNHLRLVQLQEELKSRMRQEELTRAKAEIYASIIHDLNGPLTVIGGFIELIQSDIEQAGQIEGETLATLKERIARIDCQIRNCIGISQRYLDFLRQRPGEERGRSPINQVLQDAGELLRVHPSARNHQLLIRSLPRDVVAQINATDLIQALLNLGINALQSSPANHRVEIFGRLLTQPLDRAWLQPTATNCFLAEPDFANSPPLVSLSVHDDGSGIPPTILPHIFDPYFTTKPSSQGTGLGLAIVKRLILEAKGAIRVDSHSEGGTEFTIFLPVVSPPNNAETT